MHKKNEIMKQISCFDTAKDARTMLENSFASKSRAKAIQVREELQLLKKGNLSINKYMLKIKMLADELDTAGCGLNDEQKLMTVLWVWMNLMIIFSLLLQRQC